MHVSGGRMGKIIVIEGTDGSGKRTQAEKLYERLKTEGKDVMMHSFPTYDSASCGPVKMYLNGEFGTDMQVDAYQASILYATDRLCTYLAEYKKFYENGGILILDRYVTANMLHQASKLGSREEIDKFLDWVEELEFNTLKLPKPDKVIYLDVPLDIRHVLATSRGAYKSGKARDIHEENEEHMSKAYKNGKYVTEKYNWQVITCANNTGMRTMDDIHNEIYNNVINMI